MFVEVDPDPVNPIITFQISILLQKKDVMSFVHNVQTYLQTFQDDLSFDYHLNVNLEVRFTPCTWATSLLLVMFLSQIFLKLLLMYNTLFNNVSSWFMIFCVIGLLNGITSDLLRRIKSRNQKK